MPARIPLDRERIADICRRYQIRTFALFGSVLRDDFRPDSDVDVLVEFPPEARISLFDIVDLKDELAALFGREVDVVEKEALRNPFPRRAILQSAETISAA
ncbi:MAG: nucleotidyltransferase domain-containing protein [Chloroflexi bacterium]|nr:nucleotidyltransferase domain-containing protein [Chloroflexota bacterium]